MSERETRIQATGAATLPVDPASLYPEPDGFLARRTKARRAKLLAGIEDVLRCALAPGETLLFFTDGVVEAEDRDGRDYGADRLTSVLGSATDEAPDALIARCLQDVRSFQDAGRGADDLLLFAVRAAGDAASSAAA